MPHKRLGMEMAMKNRRFSKVFKVLLAGMLMIITSVSACRVEASAYMEEPLICGDVDGDWIVSSQDALTVLKIVVNLQKPDAERFSAADVDDDGSITSADALLILKNVVGLEAVFPAQLSHPEMLFGFSDQELELYYGASYYRNYNKNIPASYMISKEIRVDKQGTLQCAGYATALAFRYYGEDVTGQQIYDEIVDKEMDGTVAPDVLASFIDERGGYRGTLYMGTIEHLKSAVSTGKAVILFSEISPSNRALHYMNVTGYDEKKIYVADPNVALAQKSPFYNREITYRDLNKIWQGIDLFIVVEKV